MMANLNRGFWGAHAARVLVSAAGRDASHDGRA